MNYKLNNRTKLQLASILISTTIFTATINKANAMPENPVYLGVSGGIADVDWSAMIKHDLPNLPITERGALDASNPAKAGGFGSSWGIYSGIQITDYFAIQADYNHYPTKEVKFSVSSGYNKGPQNNGIDSGKSSINCWNIAMRPSIYLWNHKLRSFMLVGLNIMRRSDPWAHWNEDIAPETNPKKQIFTNNNLGGIFGVGFDYQVKNNIDVETGFTYSTGQAKATDTPMFYYFPFLYRAYMGVSYRI